MMLHQKSYRWIGAISWLGISALTVGGWSYSSRSMSQSDGLPQATLSDAFFQVADRISIRDPAHLMQRGDPIFLDQNQNGQWIQIGYVTSVTDDSLDGRLLHLNWYHSSISPKQIQWTGFQTSGSLQEVLATMLPDSKRKQLQQKIELLLATHGQELVAEFTPIIRDSLLESLPILERSLKESIVSHQSELDSLGQRLEVEVIQQHLLPLARQELLPIVRRHGEPVAETIGREIWDQASLWRFGWRAFYDKTPLPERDLLQQEWKRFVDEEATPIFEAHLDEIVTAVQRVLADIAANPNIRHEVSEVLGTIASDPEAQQLLRVILRESILDNEALQNRWRDIWSSDRAVHAFQLAGDRIEPMIRQIGDDLFGTPEEGINPDFARVLRNQILGKDRRWIVAAVDSILTATAASGTSTKANHLESEIPTLLQADHSMPYPLVYLAKED